MGQSTSQTARKTVGNKEWIAFFGIMLALGIIGIDVNIVATTSAIIVRELNGLALVYWLFTAYLLTLTILLPIAGKLSDIFGRKRFLVIGMGIFVFGSILSGLSQTFLELIIFRGIQGVGAGIDTSLAVATASLIFPPEYRGKIVGANLAALFVGTAIAPGLAAYIVQVATWRWIFFVNIPMGIFDIALILLTLREPVVPSSAKVVDYRGMILLPTWIVVLVLAITRYGSSVSYFSPQIIGLFVSGAVLLASFLLVESKSSNPILPLPLFKERTFATSMAVNFLRNGVFLAVVVYVPLFIQESLGGSIGETRNAVYFVVIPLIVGSLLGGALVNKLSYKKVVSPSLALATLSLALLLSINTSTTESYLWLCGALLGFAVGAMASVITSAAQFSVSRKDMGVATSQVFFFLFLGGTIVSSIVGTIQSDALSSNLASILSNSSTSGVPQSILSMISDPNALGQILTNPSMSSRVPSSLLLELRTAVASSIVQTIWVSLILSIAATLISLLLNGSAPGLRKNLPKQELAPALVEQPFHNEV